MNDGSDIVQRLQPIVKDPEAFYQQVLAQLVKEKGQDWVDKNRPQLDANWHATKFLLGL